MEAPTAADLERALELVRATDEVSRPEDFARRTLPLLRTLIGADAASYTEAGADGSATRWLFDPPGDPFPRAVASFEAHLVEHPVVAYFARTGDLRPRTLSEFLTLRELRRRTFYQETLRPIDANYHLATALPGPSPVPIGIGFMRSRPDFTQRERRLLDLLRPHLVGAYERLRQRSEAEERLAALERGLELDRRGVVVLRAGSVDAASAEGARLLREWFGAGPPPLPANGEPLVVARGDAELRLRLVPGDPRLLLLDELRYAPDPERVRALGLTRRETEVLSLAARALADAEIAAQLVVSVRTVQKHLEHAYRKLGVGTREAAVARLLGRAAPARIGDGTDAGAGAG